MQATPISNVLPDNAPVSPGLTIAASAAQPASPFAALFQGIVKTSKNNGDLSAAGMPEDSTRQPDKTTTKLTDPVASFMGIEASLFVPLLQNPVAPVPPSLPKQDGDVGQGSAVPADGLFSSAPSASTTSASQPNLPAGVPDPSSAPIPANGASTGTPDLSPADRFQLGLPAQELAVAAATKQESNHLNEAPGISQADSLPHATATQSSAAPLARKHSATNRLTRPPAISTADAQHGNAAKQDLPAAPPAPQNMASAPGPQPSVPSTIVPAQAAQSVSVADLNISAQPWNWTSNPDTLSNAYAPAISLADALRISAAKQNSAAAPPAPEDTASAPPAQPTLPTTNIPVQAARSASVAGLNVSTQEGKGNWTSNPDTRSNGVPRPISPADAVHVSAAKQDSPAAPPAPEDTASAPPAQPNVATPNVPAQAAQSAPVVDLNGSAQLGNGSPDQVTRSDPFSIRQPQSQSSPSQQRPGHGYAPGNVTDFANLASLLPTRSDVSLLTQQPPDVAPAAANTVAPVPNPAANNAAAQSDSQLPAGLSMMAPSAILQAAVKTTSIGAAGPTSHESGSSHTASSAGSAADVSQVSKPQWKDASNGSAGNETSAKPDHNSNSSGAQPDPQAFARSIDAASAGPGAAVISMADAAGAGAATRAPAEPHKAGADTGPGANTGTALQQSLATPGADGTISVISAARTMDHSGGTEVRIEMQSDSLGSVELRAHVSGNQIGASIAVEHHDAEVMLSTELPALHSALIEKNIRVDTLVVSQGAHASMGGGPGGEPGQKNFTPFHAKPVSAGQRDSPFVFPETPSEWTGSGEANARLSVLA